MMNSVALLPTLFRASGLERAYTSLVETVHNVQIVIAHEADDVEAARFAERYGLLTAECKYRRGPAHAWNEALKACPDGDIYILASDDAEYLAGWYQRALSVLPRAGLVGLNDSTGKYERTGWATQYIMARDFIIQHNGGVAACPHYRVDFTDVEACERAKRAGVFAYCPDAFVIHHWRRVDDDGYREADKHRKDARRVYERRKAEGFPDDFERII